MIKYHQKTSDSFCLSGFVSSFHCIGDNRGVPALVNSIEESLTLQKQNFKNIIHFVNAIMTNRIKIEGKHSLLYNMTIWNKNDAFDIQNYMSEYFTLVQLMDSLVNVNHDISKVGHWIFDSNY